jgi:endonuclease/exonuclease/phosphatase (EEP) superfamily protein YafD
MAALGARYPYCVRNPLENTYGLHLFSRLELRDVRVRNLVTPDIPSVAARVRLRSGKELRLYGVHPEPPQVGNDVDERDAELLLLAREVAGSPHDVIVCGDLNDVAWSHTTRLFQRISGLLDPRVGRGLYPTFHADHWFARWPLDHIFHGAAFRLDRLEVLGHVGSDHFPVHVRLVYDPAAVREHDVPDADASDHEEASEKIAEAGATSPSFRGAREGLAR